jgi:hypothetical protein
MVDLVESLCGEAVVDLGSGEKEAAYAIGPA